MAVGLSVTVGSSMGDLLAQLLDMILQKVCCYEHLVVCISCHHQGLLI